MLVIRNPESSERFVTIEPLLDCNSNVSGPVTELFAIVDRESCKRDIDEAKRRDASIEKLGGSRIGNHLVGRGV